MLLKSKKSWVITMGVCLAVLFLFSPKILAESKKQLEQIVMEHDMKIQQLETKVNQLASSQTSQSKPISIETQAALQKEYDFYVKNLLVIDYNNPDVKMNLVNTKFVQKDGKNVYQLFFEGNYDWTLHLADPNSNWGSGRVLAVNFTRDFDIVNKMYGVDADVEFYQNGEQIKVFAK